MSSSHRKRRTLVAPEMNLSLDQSEGSLLSDDFLDTPDDLDINVDDIDTPDETDSLEFITNGNELEWEGAWLKCTCIPFHYPELNHNTVLMCFICFYVVSSLFKFIAGIFHFLYFHLPGLIVFVSLF